MRKILLPVLPIVLALGTFLFFRNGPEPELSGEEKIDNINNNTSAPAIEPDPNVSSYTLEEVSRHGGSKTYDDTKGYETYSCWMVIHGKVYDVTDFIEPHPGGHIIEEGCGLDATELFETRPQGSGTPHSDSARQILEQYYIGELKQ